MPSTPLITTVIPTYRRPHMLRRAIRSVLDQTYPHFKICVYDNASNDETGEVASTLASRDSRVHYHCHPENIGAQNNFLFGLSKVDTPLLHFMSDDDFLLPGFFAQAIAALQENPGAAFFSGGLLSANPDGQVRGFLRYGSEAAQVYCPPKLFHLLAPYMRAWTSALFRRTSVEALGGLKKETGYSFSGDLILRSATRFEAVLSDTPCAVFTVHSGSSSVAQASEAFESDLNLVAFDSVNQAIDSALRDKIVTERDADEMKTLFRTVMEQNFIRGAFGLIVRCDLPVAVRASEVLADRFKRKDIAAVINVAALDNRLGAILRLAIRSARAARKLWFAGKTAVHYPAHSEMVKNRILQLNA
jgi:glycosyltransferase involved in cell wall biosynthesis